MYQNVHVQEFAFDTICMCTCGTNVADIRHVHGVVWSFQHLYVIRLTKVLIYGSGIGSGKIHDRIQKSGNLTESRLLSKVAILSRFQDSGPTMDLSQNPGPNQDLARTAILARFWFGPGFWLSEPDPGPSSDLDKTDILARSWIGPGFGLGPARNPIPGPIYRPLSIATSVENDWGRWGPFWQVRLTLALETARF